MAVAAGAAAVIGGGASYLGSKKQSDASKKGANLQMQQFQTLNAQQQPFIQSGYGAMSRINTLLGLGGNAQSGGSSPGSMPSSAYAPMPNGGMQQRIPSPVAQGPGAQGTPDIPQNMRLKQILALRAQNGDSEAARVLQSI